jgi:hypothetical protein
MIVVHEKADLWNAHDFIASGTLRFSREWWMVAAMNRTAAIMAANVGTLLNIILQAFIQS